MSHKKIEQKVKSICLGIERQKLFNNKMVNLEKSSKCKKKKVTRQSPTAVGFLNIDSMMES